MNAIWTCPHARISSPRLRTYQSGHWRYLRQCLDCGETIGGAISKAVALAEANGNPEPFDESLRTDWWNARVDAQAAQLERERAEWWDWYDGYLTTDAWHVKRQKVLSRAGGICEGCAERPPAHVHHKTYEHVGRELLFELVALCLECHEIAHSRRASDE